MSIITRTALAFAVVGCALLITENCDPTISVPYPGAGLSVKTIMQVHEAGQYRLLLTMPVANPRNDLMKGGDILCSLEVQVSKQSQSAPWRKVSSFSFAGGYGFGGTQMFKSSEFFELAPSEHVLEIKSSSPCMEAQSRGATLSLEQEVTHITERFLFSQARHFGAIILLVLGLLTLVVYEFKRA
jgi:hypothetical protein